MAVVVGASVFLFDPIFQGLAISLMAGEVASLLISRMAVPVLYFMAYEHRKQRPPSVAKPDGDKRDHSLKTKISVGTGTHSAPGFNILTS